MRKNILITGATGFVGADLMKRVLLGDRDNRVYLIVRGAKGKTANERVKMLAGELFEDAADGLLRRIKVFEGDITKRNLSLDPDEFQRLVKEVDEIYHCAAITEFGYPINEIRIINVRGTENILKLALKGLEVGRPKRLFHISTAYVVGTKRCLFRECDLNIGQGFNNTYEQSKYEAELLIEEYKKKDVDIIVFRPSIITGDSKTGKTSNFKMFYKPLHFFSEEIFDEIPAREDTIDNLVPIDMVAEAIYLIANDKDTNQGRYHIVHPHEINFGYFLNIASEFFGFKKPVLIPPEEFDMDSLTPVQRRILEPYIPYFNYQTKFDSSMADRILKKHNFIFPDYDKAMLNTIFRFCVESGFIKPKKRFCIAA